MRFLIFFAIVIFGFFAIWISPNLYREDDSDLFFSDHMIGLKNYAIYELGVSGDPKNVIIGQDNFMFLGERHMNAYSRYANKKDETALLDKFFTAANSLHRISQSHNLPILVNIVPSKGSIYSEKLPSFLRNEEVPYYYVIDALSKLQNPRFFTNRNALIEQKEDGHVYHAWDSHWNAKGAYVGYENLMTEINSHTSLEITSTTIGTFEYEVLPYSGDLSRMLKLNHLPKIIQNHLLPYGPTIKNTYIKKDLDVFQSIIDNNSFKIERDSIVGKKMHRLGTNHQSILTHTPSALNKVNLLWFTDSFGTNMSPFMHETFVNVAQIHPRYLTNLSQMKAITEEFRPELIVITLAERHSLEIVSRIAEIIEQGIEQTSSSCRYNEMNMHTATFSNLATSDYSVFDALNNDPHILLNINVDCLTPAVRVHIQSEKSDIIKLYHAKAGEKFLEDRARNIPLKKGWNDVYIEFPTDVTQLRIDPVMTKGSFRISTISLIGADAVTAEY
ncbi:hypothetical protein JC525_16915 [Alteromonas sp. IB21]|uniref:alginate O-acetyltransferase AlgX-related protein n=1 Tax=Alteromonas sp. IB21 TaxID=2779369 RepID=UPI0018E81BD3|nr:hypothetical protein [Alteromonas sp. IB21]MBJ2130612.1 hypothetical protein [Alteromonas sp. IB21]